MIQFFKRHPNGTMVGATVFFLAALAVSFSWGLLDLIAETNQILNFRPTPPQAQGFDLKAAAAVNWKGLAATGSATGTAPRNLQNL
ncbi:MAG: hypothetical protein KGJ13_05540 [Patescibacteria group bacterium]|nr:hypothetical protein [Patescibacteria group bacterium]